MNNSDLKVYKPKSNGRMDGSSQVTSGVVQNVFPHVTSAQRTSGLIDYYKTFWKVADDDDGTLLDPLVYIDAPTAGDDWVMLFEMGQRDEVEDITGYATGTDTERKYGVAYLAEDIAAGASTLYVDLDDDSLGSGDDAIFESGDTIILTDKQTADAVSGNEEQLTISSGGVVTDSSSGGTRVQITVEETIANSYTAAASPTITSPRVCSCLVLSDLETSFTAPVVSSTSGTFASAGGELYLDNIGTVDEDWTITFTDATNFRLDGDSLGTGVATGSVGTEFAPSNSDFTKPYFTIETAAWGGTWEAGDTVSFTTHPAAVGIGFKRVVPAGSGSLANNKVSQVLDGESAS